MTAEFRSANGKNYILAETQKEAKDISETCEDCPFMNNICGGMLFTISAAIVRGEASETEINKLKAKAPCLPH